MARSRIHSQVWRLPASVVVTVTSLQLVVAASALLDRYGQIRAGRLVPDDDTDPLNDLLKLSGIVIVRSAECGMRNRGPRFGMMPAESGYSALRTPHY